MTGFAFSIGARRFFCCDLYASDAADVIALHRRVFASDVDMDWWQWKYQSGSATGVRDEQGCLVAHCGGVPRRLTHAGQLMEAVQIGDVMVAPEVRGLLTRRGPFFQVSRHFYTSRIGTDRTFEIAFGFPSERHLALGIRLGLLWGGETILEHQWSGAALPWGWRCTPLAANAPNFNMIVDTAWTTMHETLGDRLAGCRNADYLRWRYLDRPGQKYLLFRLQRIWQQHSLGILVLRRETHERMTWLDWIGSPTALPQAARIARALTQQEGAQTLTAWTSVQVTADLDTEGNGPSKVVARLGIPSTSLISQDEITHTRWWWMGGDTDFL